MSDDGVSRPRSTLRNDVIDVGDLPRLGEVGFQPLDPAHLRSRLLGALAAASVVVAAIVVGVVLGAASLAVPIGAGALVIVAVGAAVAVVQIRHTGYAVRDLDVSLRQGVFTRVVETAPFARVQDVSIDRGPIERMLGLATLNIRTAGGAISVPGIRADDAERLKSLVVDRAGRIGSAERDHPGPTDVV